MNDDKSGEFEKAKGLSDGLTTDIELGSKVCFGRKFVSGFERPLKDKILDIHRNLLKGPSTMDWTEQMIFFRHVPLK